MQGIFTYCQEVVSQYDLKVFSAFAFLRGYYVGWKKRNNVHTCIIKAIYIFTFKNHVLEFVAHA